MPSLGKAEGILKKYLSEPLTGDLKTKIELDLKSAGYSVKRVRFSFILNSISVLLRSHGRERKIIVEG